MENYFERDTGPSPTPPVSLRQNQKICTSIFIVSSIQIDNAQLSFELSN